MRLEMEDDSASRVGRKHNSAGEGDGEHDGAHCEAKKRRISRTKHVQRCSSCQQIEGKKQVCISGQQLLNYASASKPDKLLCPFRDRAREVHVCKPCAMD